MAVCVYFQIFLVASTNVLSSNWNYENIDEWNDLSNSYCSGQHKNTQEIYPQSPININTNSIIKGNCELDWKISKTIQNVSFELLNTGHSLQIIPVHLQSTIDQNMDYYLNDNIFSIAHLTTNSDERFCLHSIHFHWGTNNSMGSEHTIDNVRYPLEAHFVHFLCKYSSISDAISTGKTLIAEGDENPYTLAVIGVLFELQNEFQSTSNSTFDHIFEAIGNNSLPDHQSSNSSLFMTDFNLRDLLPETLTFYTYEGSLTTPLCSPIVRWYVLQNMMEISVEYMVGFRDILDIDLFRGIQSLVSGAYVSECDIGSDGSFGGKGSDIGSIAVLGILISVAVFSLVAYVMFIKMKKGDVKNVTYRSVSGTQEERDHLSDSECG